MNIKVILSALLHDVGKLIQRTQIQDGRPHYTSGYDFIKNYTHDEDILNSVLFHHKSQIDKAKIAANSIAISFTYRITFPPVLTEEKAILP